jgi:hypothetical protein
LSTLQNEPLLLTHRAHAHCLQFEHSGNGLMSHIRESSKVTINTSYFHPAHQHYTDEAQKAETVPSVVSYIHIYIYIYILYTFIFCCFFTGSFMIPVQRLFTLCSHRKITTIISVIII